MDLEVVEILCAVMGNFNPDGTLVLGSLYVGERELLLEEFMELLVGRGDELPFQQA